MTRLHLPQEALQKLSSARLSLEKAIREAKTLMHQPGGNSDAQSCLVVLKRDATLLYIFLASLRGKAHCPTSEERLESLRKRGTRGSYLSETEKLLLGLLNTPAPAPAPAREAATPA
jgi:hypothetical protein